MDRRAFLTAASVVPVAGCIDFVESENFEDGDIGMSSDSFRPVEYTIEAGDTVTWVNTSSKAHTVTAYDELIPPEAEYFATGGYPSQEAAEDAWFDGFGGRLDTDETYSHTFEIPGEYDYYCIPHIRADMVGRIIVE